MIPPKLINGLLLGSLLITNQAFADSKVAESHDWTLWETTVDNQESCYLQNVNKAIFRAEDYFLELHKLKNKANSPVEIMMRIQKNKKVSTGLLASVSATASSISFSDMNDQKEIFWGLPKNLSALTEQLKAAQQDVAVKAKGGKKEIDITFTGRGFKEMLTEMQNRCNNGANLVNETFESELLAGVAQVIEPTQLTSLKTNQLRAIYFSAYSLFSVLTDTKIQLQQVLAKYQPLVDELKANRVLLVQILNQDLPNSQNTLVEAQKQQVDSKNEIAKIDSLLPSLIAKVDAAQVAYNKSRAILDPLVPEFNRINENLRSSQIALSDATSRLSAIDNRLQMIAQQVSSLSDEANRIEQWLPQKRNELDRAISVHRDAEARRSQYNISWERDRRLNNNGEFNHMLSERSSIQNNLNQVQSEVNQIQSERNRIANDVNQCHASQIQITAIVQTSNLVPGAIATGADDGSLTPPEDGGLTPAEPRDCSQLEQALDRANAMLAEKQNLQNNLASRKNELDSRISLIQRQVDQEVRAEYDRLSNQEDLSRREMNRIQDDVNRDQSRLSQIRISDLPRLENERGQLSSERPSVVSRIGNSRSDIDRLNRELAQFKFANNWDQKAADVDTKARQLASDQGSLAAAQSQKATALDRIEKAVNTELQMKKLIASLNAQVISLNQRAAVLDQSLKNLPAERAPIDTHIEQVQNEISTQKNELLNLLK